MDRYAPPELLVLSIEDVSACIGDIATSDELLALWLTAAELRTYETLRLPKRRREWLAGRVAAKEVVRRRYGLAGGGGLGAVEIVTEPRGRPSYRLGMRPARFGLSISHVEPVAVAALARHPGEAIGVDVERVEARGPGFESLLLSPREKTALEGVTGTERSRRVTQIWAVKEAVSKALGIGLRLPLPRVESGLFGSRAARASTVAVPPDIAPLASPEATTLRVGLFDVGSLVAAWAVALKPVAS
jgi:phosphopantetheinyl transferase